VVVRFDRELFVGLFYGSVYYSLDSGSVCDLDPTCTINRSSLMFFSVMLMFMGHLDSVGALMDDRLVFYRERGVKAYGAFEYWLSVFLPQLPILVFNVLFYSIPCYHLVGLRKGGRHFLVFYFFLLFINYNAMFFAYTIACLSPTTVVALCLFPSLLMLNAVYAGFLVYIPAIPEWQRAWLPIITFFRYAYQGLMLNEFQDNSTLPETHALITSLGFNNISVQGCFGILCIFMLILSAAMYLALRYIDFEKR
jgi:hypothetical protein